MRALSVKIQMTNLRKTTVKRVFENNLSIFCSHSRADNQYTSHSSNRSTKIVGRFFVVLLNIYLQQTSNDELCYLSRRLEMSYTPLFAYNLYIIVGLSRKHALIMLKCQRLSGIF